MSKFKEELIEVEVIGNTERGVELKCTIQKEVMMEMFYGYDFQRTVEQEIVKHFVKHVPIEWLNEVRSKIDLDAVAKLATIELARNSAGRN